MKKIYYVLNFFCFFFSHSLYAAEFIPTPETCGAARTEHEQEIGHYTTPNHRIACMIAGYKNVYWATEAELGDIKEQFLPLEKHGIKKLKPSTKKNYSIVYTDSGEKNARLLAKYLALFEYENPNFQRQMSEGSLYYNDYLIGSLLGYSKKDITYYYFQVLHYPQEQYDDDKKKALEYIQKLLPEVESDMKRAREQARKKNVIKQEDNLVVKLNNLEHALANLLEAL